MAQDHLKDRKKAMLLLEDGTAFSGYSFGCEGEKMGEISFTTGSTGYQELLTDPCCFGSIVVQTFPLIGNYGVNGEDNESERCWVSGYVVREWCRTPSNFRMQDELDAFLKRKGVVGLYGIDTRALTRKIREDGEMRALITTEPVPDLEEKCRQLREWKPESAVPQVSVPAPVVYKSVPCKRRVTVYDFGCKKSLIQALTDRGCTVTLVPWDTPAHKVLDQHPDGVLLSDAADDPRSYPELIETAKQLLAAKVPLFGIGFGHLLLALANGFAVAKLRQGHRGENQPVTRCMDGRVLISAQNHGYVVRPESVDEEKALVSYVNSNDKSCEGLRYRMSPASGVQFHPEACGGPQELTYVFDEFADEMDSFGGMKHAAE